MICDPEYSTRFFLVKSLNDSKLHHEVAVLGVIH